MRICKPIARAAPSRSLTVGSVIVGLFGSTSRAKRVVAGNVAQQFQPAQQHQALLPGQAQGEAVVIPRELDRLRH